MPPPRTPKPVPPPTPPPPPPKNGKQVALWAGAAAFFGSVLAVGAFDLLGIDGLGEFFISIMVALFTAGAIYSKERLAFAKK